MKRNEVVLPDELYTIETNDKIPDNCKYALALIQVAQNKNQTNIGGLAKLLKLRIGAKVMLAVTIIIQNCLINCQIGNTKHIEFAQVSVCKVNIKFSDD